MILTHTHTHTDGCTYRSSHYIQRTTRSQTIHWGPCGGRTDTSTVTLMAAASHRYYLFLYFSPSRPSRPSRLHLRSATSGGPAGGALGSTLSSRSVWCNERRLNCVCFHQQRVKGDQLAAESAPAHGLPSVPDMVGIHDDRRPVLCGDVFVIRRGFHGFLTRVEAETSARTATNQNQRRFSYTVEEQPNKQADRVTLLAGKPRSKAPVDGDAVWRGNTAP